MKVLHIGKYYPPFHGGIECYMGDLLPALQAQGIRVSALVHEHSKTEAIEHDFVYRAPTYGELLFAPISPLFPFILSRLLTKRTPDILHLHLPNTSAFWALFIASARRVPWVIHWHADVNQKENSWLSFAYKAYKPLETRLLSRCDAIIVTSSAYLESSQALAPWKEKCHNIPLGRSPKSMPMLRRADINKAQALWRPKYNKVLVVSRMSHYKGLEHLIDAIARIDTVQLIVVGKNTRKGLQELVRQTKTTNRVTLLDHQPNTEMHALMATCDCICLPSINRSEAFGLVLLEAMYYGKPAIASNIPGSGVGWVVQDNLTGKLVTPRNIDELSYELDNINSNKQAWKELGINAKTRFTEVFDIQHSVGKIICLYNSLIKNK